MKKISLIIFIILFGISANAKNTNSSYISFGLMTNHMHFEEHVTPYVTDAREINGGYLNVFYITHK